MKAALLKIGEVVLEQEKPPTNPLHPFQLALPLPLGSSPRTTQWGKNASAPRGQRGNSNPENSQALFNYFKKGQINNTTPRRGWGTGAGKEASLRGVAWADWAPGSRAGRVMRVKSLLQSREDPSPFTYRLGLFSGQTDNAWTDCGAVAKGTGSGASPG